ncbi:hypothetical protein [Methanosarcina siciliae]|uniref:hypothetical protein n=1 Tax=Methanosarcina siciliae TaxID=38027 RepID=UPI000B3046CA|nr:hypothetical protein [Methanosarcina siciliae]
MREGSASHFSVGSDIYGNRLRNGEPHFRLPFTKPLSDSGTEEWQKTSIAASSGWGPGCAGQD